MKNKDAVVSMCISALLCALGIMIPMFMPKIVIPPMSFTLASHVPIFIAMFISPASAVMVTVVTSIGFALSMPLVVALRAASHLVFVLVGAYMLKKSGSILQSMRTAAPFGLLMAVLHGVCEAIVVTASASWAVMRYSDLLTRRLGPSGTLVLGKLMGFILICIGVQFVGSGIRTFMAGA